MAFRFLKSRFRFSPSIERSLDKAFDKSQGLCLDKKFSVVIPSFPSGCPGSLQPCPSKSESKNKQKEACGHEAKEIILAMQRAFGTGNTRVTVIGGWVNPETRKFEDEKGIRVETRYSKSCLTKAKTDELISSIDRSMGKLCQSQWYVETDKRAEIINTGKRRA